MLTPLWYLGEARMGQAVVEYVGQKLETTRAIRETENREGHMRDGMLR